VGEALGFPGGIGEFLEKEAFHFATDVALISIAAATIGVGVALYLWSGDGKRAGQLRERFRPAYDLFKNKYYLDTAYQWAINNVVLAAGNTVAWFDRNVVNDTGVDGSARLTVFSGFLVKFSQTGKLPNYALAIVAGVIVLAIVFLTVQA
jgi:NADH-quinone oxidoreductase subunit L